MELFNKEQINKKIELLEELSSNCNRIVELLNRNKEIQEELLNGSLF